MMQKQSVLSENMPKEFKKLVKMLLNEFNRQTKLE